MTRWFTRAALGLVLLLGIAAVALSQQQGGAFLPTFSYLISGQWTWRSQASPFVFEGTTDNAFETTFTVTNPTADRTVTVPDATGTFLLGTSAGAAKFAAGNSIKTTNPLSVTTGLATLVNCSATPVSTSDALAVMVSLQLTASAGRLDIYSWKTSGAAQTSSTLFTWGCSGT